MSSHGCGEGSDSDVDLQEMWTSLGAAHGRCAYLSEMQVRALGPKEEAKRTRGQKVVVMTFEQLQQAVAQLSPADRLDLYRSCPSPRPLETLLALETSTTSSAVRFCARCLVAFSQDGRALNAPGRRHERGDVMSDERLIGLRASCSFSRSAAISRSTERFFAASPI
jgi:hypothetical protein